MATVDANNLLLQGLLSLNNCKYFKYPLPVLYKQI